MTCIVDPIDYPTKQSLKAAVAADPSWVWIHDPSAINSWSRTAGDLRRNEEVCVTNHPKRSWFAQVGRKADGTLYVK